MARGRGPSACALPCFVASPLGEVVALSLSVVVRAMTSASVPPARVRPPVETTTPAEAGLEPADSSGAAQRTARGIDQPLSMRVSRPGGRVVVLHVYGAVDAAGQPWLAEIVRERLDSFAARLVLDLSRVTFFDSEAALTLLDAAHHARVRAKPFTVLSSPAVDRIMGLLAMHDRICWTTTVAEAGFAGSESPSAPV